MKILWSSMVIGQSEFVPGMSHVGLRNMSDAASRQTGHRYRVKAEADGARVWRIE